MNIFKAITNFFRAQPQFDLETGEMLPVVHPPPGVLVTVHYPCGCSVTGTAELPQYCPGHEVLCDSCGGTGEAYILTEDSDEQSVACSKCKGRGYESTPKDKVTK